MKNKLLMLCGFALVVVATVAHAARTHRTVTVINESVVSPLDGYADQISGDYVAAAAAMDLGSAPDSLLDK